MSAVISNIHEERDKALGNALREIEKDYGPGSVMMLDDDAVVNVEAISTGSIGIDRALGVGGIPRGRIIEVYGPESSGKTTLTLQIIAQAQKDGGRAAKTQRSGRVHRCRACARSCLRPGTRRENVGTADLAARLR